MKEVYYLCSGQLETMTYFVPFSKDELLVIDPGGDFFEINSLIKEIGIEPAICLLTHSHADHVASLGELKKTYPKMKILAHEAEKNLYGPGSLEEQCMQTPEVAPDLLHADLPPLDGCLKDDDIIAANWKVIHTPGHTPGSICLYNEEKRILFTGDTYFEKNIYGRTDFYGGSKWQLFESLKKLEPYLKQAKYIYPGH